MSVKTVSIMLYAGAAPTPPPDTTAPTFTSANPSGGYAEMAPVGGTLTADEAATFSKSGADAARVTLNPSTGVWSLETTDFETKASYSWTFTATDAASNATNQNVAITITDVDEIPAAFSFTDVTNATTSTQYTSNTITVSGLAAGVSVPVAVSGGTYSKNGGAYTSAGGTAQNGDTFSVRQTSSASNSTGTNVVLTIGGVSDTYTVTTSAGVPGTAASLASIDSSGWQGVWSGTPPTLTPDGGASAQHYIYATRQGYDSNGAATSYLDRFICTQRVRQPYPNQALLTSNNVALSEYIYATDTISGVTNNSTEVSPKPVANWVMPSRMVVANSVTLEVVAFHRNGVACVEFSATDGTTTVTQKVSATAVSGRSGDQHAVLTYKASLDISTLADNALVICNAKVYPQIGATASIADSSGSSIKREFSPRFFLKNVSLAASPPYAYVAKAANAGAGIGTPSASGVVSSDLATAKATPFDTVSSAMTGLRLAKSATTGMDGCIIMVGDDAGTAHVLSAVFNTYTQKCGALTITRDPNVPKANARVSWGASSFRPLLGGALLPGITETALRFVDIQLVRTGTSVLQGEAGAQLQIVFDQCDIDNGGQNFTWLSNSHDYHFGTTLTNASGSNIVTAATYEHRLFRGLNWQPTTITGGNQMEGFLVLGCALKNPVFVRGTRTRSGGIIAFNEVRDMPSTTPLLHIASDEDVTNFAYVQNLHEWLGTNQNNALGVSPDSATGNDTHVIIWNNSYAGAFLAGRWNVFYDEGTTARTSKLQSVKGNIAVQINTKSDVFRGVNQSGADASSRTGNWAFMYGVGCQGNFSQYIDASGVGLGSSFAQAYPGLGCSIGTSTTVRNDPLFISNQAVTYNGTTYTAGAGGGDYHLQAGSPCKGMAVLNRLLTHDLDGNARPATADSAGAYV